MEMQCIVSEVLCYTQNHFSGATRDNMVTALTGCYNEDEILIAKNLLFSVVDGMASKPDGLSRNIKRQDGEIKKLHNCRDMLTLYRELDQAKAELPRFVAANLARIPTVKPGEVDIYYMAVTVANLSTQLEKVTARLAAWRTRNHLLHPSPHRMLRFPDHGPNCPRRTQTVPWDFSRLWPSPSQAQGIGQASR